MWAVFFLFLSYLDRDLAKGQLSALDAERESHVLYFLLNTTLCAHSSACRVGLNPQKADDANSKSVRRQEAEDRRHAVRDEHSLRRSKRGFTYPGTLWCGAGNIADNYDQLGEFAETDKCCRTHDHCPHVIHAFTSKYGFTNFKWHSISHCDCDNAMKQCLREVNDTSSRVVGQAFFNVIEVPCFEFSLEEQCVERYWYGMCKRYDKVPVAVLRESVPYDFGDIEVIDVLTIAPPKVKLSETDENKEEPHRSENTTQSSTSGSKNPEPVESSLTNVVTAAEDFIKVLATVSTSQGSSIDGGNTGETQTLDKKKKRKDAGKKKKDLRGKRKLKKKKQNAGSISKDSERVTGTPSAHRSESVINKKNFVEDSENFMDSKFTFMGDIEHFNKMMKDEQQRTPDGSQVDTTTAPDAKQKAIGLGPQKQVKDKEFVQLFSTVPFTTTSKLSTAMPKHRMAKKRQRHPTSIFLPIKGNLQNMMADNTTVSTTESTSLAGLTTHTPISVPWEDAPHNVESHREKGAVFNAIAENTPIVETKGLRSRQKGGRRKSWKLYKPSSPTDSLTAEKTKVLLTDRAQRLTGPFPEPHSALQRLQSNGTRKMEEKTKTGVSLKTQCKISKGSQLRNSAQKSKSKSSMIGKAQQEALAIMATSTSAIIDLATQVRGIEASGGQLFSSGLQTITPTMLPLKARAPKIGRSKQKAEKSRKKAKRTCA
ncbi:uncharacterized protein proca1 [Clarias gariepinus]|uniref:uncharacterized protein proca1 n=1 Tax=Clarias gariepinus TaxID=13013 RepID=UPI00234C9F8E|nr:uncharacterized protein proca1 [Clarias gariepinus]